MKLRYGLGRAAGYHNGGRITVTEHAGTRGKAVSSGPRSGSPKVSVVMAVHNGERFLRATVDSVLAQTFRDFEFVIVNDGSTDGTQAILEKYSREDSRIRVHCQENQCPGQAQPDNVGVSMSRGQYVARTDADDTSAPTRLARQVAFLDANPAVGCVGGFSRWQDPNGSLILNWTAPESHHQLKWQLCFGNVFAHSSVIFRREVFLDVGGYNEDCFYCEDYDLWCRLSRSTRLACLPEELVTLTRHDTSVTARYRQVQRQCHHAAACEHILALCGASPSADVDSILQGSEEGPLHARREAAGIIRALYRSFGRTERLGSDDRRAIRRDAARRLWRLSSPPAPSERVLWSSMLRACWLDPALPRDALLRKLRPLFVAKNRILSLVSCRGREPKAP